MTTKNENIQESETGLVKILVLLLLALMVVDYSTFTVKAGQSAIERTPTGDLVAHVKPGIKFKVPFLNEIEFYNEVTTITYGLRSLGGANNKSYVITLAGDHSVEVKGSLIVELPKDPDKLIELHKAFKNYENFVENGAEEFASETLKDVASQYIDKSLMANDKNEEYMLVPKVNKIFVNKYGVSITKINIEEFNVKN